MCIANHLDLTIVIPTRNEESNLPKCLSAIGDFCKVLVVDSDSRDQTVQIASNYGAEVIQFRWNGKYPKKKNWVIHSGLCCTEWILFLDADEYITQEFKEELQNRLPHCEENGFWLTYHNYFLGKRINHGIPFRKLFLLRNGNGSFQRVEDQRWTNLDMEVHEQLEIKGKVGVINAKIIHNNFDGYGDFILKHNKYSEWEAKRYLYGEEEFKVSIRQKVKRVLIDSYLLGPLYFLANYILFFGFLDGKTGILHSVAKAHYFFDVKIKIDEFRNTKKPQRLKSAK